VKATTPERQRTMTAPPEHPLHYEVSDDIRLVATGIGRKDDPPVLLLHGGGQTRQSWLGTARRLAAARRYAVALDMRGHGESTWAPSGEYRVANFAGDLLRVIEEFDRPPVVVGASLGGITALLFTELYDESLLGGVVLVDIAATLELEGAKRIGEWMLAYRDGFANLEEVADAIAEYTPQRKRTRNLAGLERVVRQGEDGRYRWHWDPRFLGEQGPAEVADRPRLLSAAKALRVPTLLVRGRESDVISPEGVAEFLEAAPHSEYADVSGAGHMVAGDRNDAFTTAVETFLDRHHPAPPRS
jgi:pimeloyl-ACP methyl ester carboxylesterase